MLKNMVLTFLIGFGILTLSGCTDSKDADNAKGKCESAKIVKTKCDAGKCDNATKK
ncbi:hypothetical protein PGH07_10100 [Sulfurovum sp. zt1-1]|uniref:Lipoprotein n=1 Tax=Sulfurovum zhangzhouensis TaxID=3019067 RepID=A0ABT7R0I0_9BACT|nr:hypothetical protein [Sulfurovum zhangzhouensis]MDM5272527.1 hypothetical protein [Sulfurovum zhangzhouensis]